MRSVVVGALACGAALAFATVAPLAAQQTQSCDRCHADRQFLAGKGGAPDADERLLVPDTILHGSAHAELTCASCHVEFDAAYPHQPGAHTVACATCHEPTAEEWQASVHAQNAGTQGDAPDCVRCHGAHRVLDASDRRSPTHPLNEAALCGACHGDPAIVAEYFADPADSVARAAVEQFHVTVHGLALARGGLVVAATCSDCHRAHRVLPAADPTSSVARDSITSTCGTCHTGVMESYERSSHGRWLSDSSEPDRDEVAPVCIDCHTAHEIVEPDATWRASVIEECGACHEALYESYQHTYHGKVTRLGSALVARCSDCHTAHANLPADHPRSSVHPTNLVDTCGQCHERVTASFAQYLSHPDHTDREKHPQLFWPYVFMTALLVGTLGFFGLHTLLWLVRGLIEKART